MKNCVMLVVQNDARRTFDAKHLMSQSRESQSHTPEATNNLNNNNTLG